MKKEKGRMKNEESGGFWCFGEIGEKERNMELKNSGKGCEKLKS